MREGSKEREKEQEREGKGKRGAQMQRGENNSKRALLASPQRSLSAHEIYFCWNRAQTSPSSYVQPSLRAVALHLSTTTQICKNISQAQFPTFLRAHQTAWF